MDLQEALTTARCSNGRTLDELSREAPTLVVLLRHMGCSFCREALHDLKSLREEFERHGIYLVVVHMGDAAREQELASRFELQNTLLISDPELHLYRAFGLEKASAGQIFSPKTWWRALGEGVLWKHGFDSPKEDPFQMPGAFLIHQGEIVNKFIHRSPADRPNYADLCGIPQNPTRNAAT